MHDLEGEGFNVDHVAVTPQGILVIETKTRSKPMGRDARIVFDGERIIVDGLEPERDPLVQARAAASWVRQKLNEGIGREFPVRPVIAFPGWFVDRTGEGRRSSVWVVEPKSIGGFLKREPILLTDADISLIISALKAHVRTTGGTKQVSWTS